MSRADSAFVADARKRWAALLEKTGDWEAHTMALAVSLWATMNVDRLLDIAEGKASQPKDPRHVQR